MKSFQYNAVQSNTHTLKLNDHLFCRYCICVVKLNYIQQSSLSLVGIHSKSKVSRVQLEGDTSISMATCLA